jgi:hypothetical protein
VATTICCLTGIQLTIEDTIKSGELDPNTKEAYEKVSGKSVEDFALWVADATFVKIFILEMKKDATATTKAVCQAIGYYMASKTDSVTADNRKIPALGMVLSQTMGWLVFFPYCCQDGNNNSQACVNAVVGGRYEWPDNQEILFFLVTFIVKYVQSASKCQPIYEASFELLPKKSYFHNVVHVEEAVKKQTIATALARVAQAEEETRKAEEEAEEEKRKAEEEKRKAEEEKEQILTAYAQNTSISLTEAYKVFNLPPPTKRSRIQQ